MATDGYCRSIDRVSIVRLTLLLLGLLVMALGFVHFAVGWRISTNGRDRFVAVGGSFVAGVIALALGAGTSSGHQSGAQRQHPQSLHVSLPQPLDHSSEGDSL